MQTKETLRLAHGLEVTHPVHQGLVRLGEVMDSLSEGAVEIIIYPAGQLGNESQCLELLQLGSLAMTKVSAAVMERFAPTYAVLSLPYIFPDRATSFAILDGPIGQELLAEGEEARLRGLTFFDAGTRCFYTKDTAVTHPRDLQGKKVRVQSSPMAVNLVRNLGGSPTAIPYGELYTALQNGVVDAAENNLPSYFSSKHYEICPFYTYNRHTAVPDVLVVGTHTWNRLSEQQRTWLQEATMIATAYQRTAWAKAEIAVVKELEALEKFNITFHEVDPAPFRAAVAPMYEAARQDPILEPLLNRIEQAYENR